jgi:hypothetical protein
MNMPDGELTKQQMDSLDELKKECRSLILDKYKEFNTIREDKNDASYYEGKIIGRFDEFTAIKLYIDTTWNLSDSNIVYWIGFHSVQGKFIEKVASGLDSEYSIDRIKAKSSELSDTVPQIGKLVLETYGSDRFLGIYGEVGFFDKRLFESLCQSFLAALVGNDRFDPLNDTDPGYPSRRISVSVRYERNATVRDAVRKRSQGKCELCGDLGFETDFGHYVECHHITTLANDGEDKVTNVIALCARHHREVHFGTEVRAKELEIEMRERMESLKQR